MATDRLLVPLDRSSLSEAALPYARMLAAAADAAVTLLTVWEPPDLDVSELAPGMVEDLRERGVQAGRAYLEQLAAGLRDAGLRTDVEVRVGSAAEEVLAAVEESGASLVVMATHGRGGLERAAYGSVADQVTRHAPVPALLVKPSPEEEAPRTPAIRRILVPLDGSELSALALPHAEAWALRLGAEVHLVRAVAWAAEIYAAPVSVYYPPTLDEELAAAAGSYLERMRGHLHRDLTVRTATVRGPAATAIQSYVREQGIDLIVMATRGRGGLVRATLGSTADRIARSGVAPVLLVRAGQPKEGS
ncbi:MAG TPA: universal stress protein [Dehalococcoidia bacterium]